MYIGLQVKYSLFLSEFNESLNFLGRFSKNPQISNYMKICQVGADTFNADRQTKRNDEANSRFWQIC
jgi:hypothetical protein